MSSPLKLNLLVIDDDPLILESLRGVTTAPWNFIGRTQYTSWPASETIHAAFVDMHLSQNFSKLEGLEVIKALSQRDPHTEIVAISGDMNRDLMEKTLKAGATRFLPKPLTPDEVTLTLNKLAALFELRWNMHTHDMQWVGESQISDQLRRQIAQLKGELSPILIEAESGSGKEVVAHLLNQQEPTRPFVTLNVASIPENLFESEFFGYAKGAFTGALQSKMGIAESANGGDLFLDEIEALPQGQQAKLLRFLENGEVRRVGSTEVVHVNVRIIAATNESLTRKVAEGTFREDLLWRLAGHKIIIPPLRERLEDIPSLSQFFLKKMRPSRNKTFSDDAVASLKNYGWPGNVRELKRVCEQLVIQSPLPLIRGEDVARIIAPSSIASPEVRLDLQRGLADLVSDFEKKVFEMALSQEKDVDALAKTLKISRSSLYKKLKDYNLSL
jgi:DNA-binding NtrC family response regulator